MSCGRPNLRSTSEHGVNATVSRLPPPNKHFQIRECRMQNSMRLTWIAGALITAALLSACGSAQSRKAAYIAHGQQYFDVGNYDKARVELRNAAQIDPKDAQVRYLLGRVAEKSGD